MMLTEFINRIGMSAGIYRFIPDCPALRLWPQLRKKVLADIAGDRTRTLCEYQPREPEEGLPISLTCGVSIAEWMMRSRRIYALEPEAQEAMLANAPGGVSFSGLPTEVGSFALRLPNPPADKQGDRYDLLLVNRYIDRDGMRPLLQLTFFIQRGERYEPLQHNERARLLAAERSKGKQSLRSSVDRIQRRIDAINGVLLPIYDEQKDITLDKLCEQLYAECPDKTLFHTDPRPMWSYALRLAAGFIMFMEGVKSDAPFLGPWTECGIVGRPNPRYFLRSGQTRRVAAKQF